MSARGNRSRISDLWRVLASACLVSLMACSSGPALPRIEAADDRFSTELAQAHLDALASLGPRLPGSQADERARDYLERAFRAVGAAVETLESGSHRHLVAGVAGDSTDVVLLVAPYALLGGDGWVDDAGPALLLELARLFAASPPPYTVRLALAEIRPERRALPSEAVPEPGWRPVAGAREARARVMAAGRDLAAALEARAGAEPGALRAVVVFEPSARQDARIARDLRSHPVFRNVFWETALGLGYTRAFPQDSEWSSPESLHGAFRDGESDLVLALVDETAARVEQMSAFQPGPASASGLEPLGRVSVEALVRLMRRLEKVDAFAR